MTLQYPYNYYTLDSNHPALYYLSLSTAPPAIQGPPNITLAVINSDTISWVVSDVFDNFGSQSYTIYKNNSIIASGSWMSYVNISLTSKESDPGIFNYTIIVSDAVGGYATAAVWVTVTGTSNGTYTSTVTSTYVNTTTTTSVSTTTSTVVSSSTVTSNQTSTVTITQSNGDNSTGTSTQGATGSSSSIKTSPGFELGTILVILFLALPFYLR